MQDIEHGVAFSICTASQHSGFPLRLIHAVKIGFQHLKYVLALSYTEVVKIATPTSTITRDAQLLGERFSLLWDWANSLSGLFC